MAQSTITTANPGNIVVPLSAIIDQLQGKLTAADLNALLLAVVGQKKNKVSPGDLITTDLINQILSELEDLQTRVAKLEAGGGTTVPSLRIIRIDGPTPIRVGSRVTVVGENFSVPATRNGIRVDSMPVLNPDTVLSSATQLVFDMPDPGLGETGRGVTLHVTNGQDQSASLVFRLEPLLRIPTGTLSILYLNPPPGTTLVAGTYDFGYRLIADVDWSASVQITAPPFTQAGWSRTILAANGNEITGAITLQRTTATHFEVPFTVRVVVPSGTSSDVLDIGAIEVTAGTHVTPAPSQRLNLGRNQPIPVPENRVVTELLGTSASVQIVGGTAIFSRNTLGRLDFVFNFSNLPSGTVQTQINLSFSLEPTSSTGWIAGTPSSGGFLVSGNQGTGDSNIRITPPNDQSTTQLLLRITAQPSGQPAIDVTYVISLQVP